MSDSEESRDEASPDAAVIENAEPTEDAETEFSPFEEIEDDFKPGPAIRVVGEDGLPKTVDQTTASDIPRLSTKTLVCMGDYSSFVLRNHWREVVGKFDAALVGRAPNGRYRIEMSKALELMKLRIEQERKRLAEVKKTFEVREMNDSLIANNLTDVQVLSIMLAEPGKQHGFDPYWVEVEPIRPPCRHYVRQKTSFSLNAEHKAFLRLCSARRTTEGTFMTVRDTGIWACDMRDPFDAESSGELDEFDEMKKQQGEHVEHLPMFGGSGGIFAGTRKAES